MKNWSTLSKRKRPAEPSSWMKRAKLIKKESRLKKLQVIIRKSSNNLRLQPKNLAMPINWIIAETRTHLEGHLHLPKLKRPTSPNPIPEMKGKNLSLLQLRAESLLLSKTSQNLRQVSQLLAQLHNPIRKNLMLMKNRK